MSNKLYVGNIPYQFEEEALKGAFEDFGTVKSVKIIKDYETGRSKGFGFVEMETDEEAEAGIEGLNGKEFNGRSIQVNIAKERAPRSNAGGGRNFNRESRNRW